MNPTKLTDEQLQAELNKAAKAAEEARTQAAEAEHQTGLAELQAEAQRREHAAHEEAKKNREHWAEWFLDGGGFDSVKKQLSNEEKQARAAFTEALHASPLGKAAAAYFAAVQNRQHAIDMREKACQILGRSYNPVVLTNRLNIVDEAVNEIHDAASTLSSTRWDDLNTTDQDTAREWVAAEKPPQHRIEEYTVPGPDAYGKPIRVRQDLDTGHTEVLDHEFLEWEAQRKATEQEHEAGPPAWAQTHETK